MGLSKCVWRLMALLTAFNHLTAAYFSEHGCVGDEIELECQSPDVIYILSAKYGQYANYDGTCPTPEAEDCFVDVDVVVDGALDALRSQCQENRTCSTIVLSEDLVKWCSVNGMDFMTVHLTCAPAGGLPTTQVPTTSSTDLTSSTKVTTEKEDDGGGGNIGAIVGGVFGGLIVLVFFIIVIVLVIRNNKSATERATAMMKRKPKQNGASKSAATDTEAWMGNNVSNVPSDPNGYDNQAFGFMTNETEPLTKAKRMSMAAAANSALEKTLSDEAAAKSEVDGKKTSAAPPAVRQPAPVAQPPKVPNTRVTSKPAPKSAPLPLPTNSAPPPKVPDAKVDAPKPAPASNPPAKPAPKSAPLPPPTNSAPPPKVPDAKVDAPKAAPASDPPKLPNNQEEAPNSDLPKVPNTTVDEAKPTPVENGQKKKKKKKAKPLADVQQNGVGEEKTQGETGAAADQAEPAAPKRKKSKKKSVASSEPKEGQYMSLGVSEESDMGEYTQLNKDKPEAEHNSDIYEHVELADVGDKSADA